MIGDEHAKVTEAQNTKQTFLKAYCRNFWCSVIHIHIRYDCVKLFIIDKYIPTRDQLGLIVISPVGGVTT